VGFAVLGLTALGVFVLEGVPALLARVGFLEGATRFLEGETSFLDVVIVLAGAPALLARVFVLAGETAFLADAGMCVAGAVEGLCNTAACFSVCVCGGAAAGTCICIHVYA